MRIAVNRVIRFVYPADNKIHIRFQHQIQMPALVDHKTHNAAAGILQDPDVIGFIAVDRHLNVRIDARCLLSRYFLAGLFRGRFFPAGLFGRLFRGRFFPAGLFGRLFCGRFLRDGLFGRLFCGRFFPAGLFGRLFRGRFLRDGIFRRLFRGRFLRDRIFRRLFRGRFLRDRIFRRLFRGRFFGDGLFGRFFGICFLRSAPLRIRLKSAPAGQFFLRKRRAGEQHRRHTQQGKQPLHLLAHCVGLLFGFFGFN